MKRTEVKIAKEHDPIEEYSIWVHEEHDTYIPPILMKDYVAPDSYIASPELQRQQTKQKILDGSASLLTGGLVGFGSFLALTAFGVEPVIATASILMAGALYIINKARRMNEKE